MGWLSLQTSPACDNVTERCTFDSEFSGHNLASLTVDISGCRFWRVSRSLRVKDNFRVDALYPLLKQKFLSCLPNLFMSLLLNMKYVYNIIQVHFVFIHVCIGEDVSKLWNLCPIQLFSIEQSNMFKVTFPVALKSSYMVDLFLYYIIYVTTYIITSIITRPTGLVIL